MDGNTLGVSVDGTDDRVRLGVVVIVDDGFTLGLILDGCADGSFDEVKVGNTLGTSVGVSDGSSVG